MFEVSCYGLELYKRMDFIFGFNIFNFVYKEMYYDFYVEVLVGIL